MLNNNMFSSGFNIGFGTGGLNNMEIKSPTKEEKFPGLNAQQIANIEKATAGLTGQTKKLEQQKLYQAMIQKIQGDNFNDSRTAMENEMYKKSLDLKDCRERNNKQSCNRQSQLVDMVKDKHNLRANTGEEEVMKMLMQEMDYKKVSMDSLDAYLDSGDESFLYEMGLKDINSEPEKGKSQPWEKIGIGAGLIAGADATLYGLGNVGERAGKKIYDFPIDSSAQESKKINQVGTKIKDAEEAVKDAKKDLKQAKKSGEGVEQAQKNLAKAQEELKNAKSNKVIKVSDTAREYNIGGGITEGWTAESRGIQASSKANQIFKKTIEPALENSKATINVQELINGLEEDIKNLAKNDPDKEVAYMDALSDLKKSYKDPKFANYSMKDSQTLKSGLQGRTPQKFFKGKEITNELQELKGILSSRLTNAVHTNLTKEIGEDSAKLYRDYANLKEYAGNMVKQSTNGGLKGGFGNFWSTAFHKATDGASSKVGLLLNKGGKNIKKITGVEKAVDSVGDVWDYIVKNGKKFIKNTKGKGLRVEDPVGLVQLLRLAPGTIGEIADQAAEMPAVAVDDILFEVQNFKDEWNKMSDEERIQNIKDQFKQAYGTELNDESAEATYEEWKKKHPKGKYGLWDKVNDVKIVMSV